MTTRRRKPKAPPPFRPKAGDDDVRPVAPTVPQDKASGVSAFFGTWPGDETDAELLALLAELDG
jgi:hypothetical protein